MTKSFDPWLVGLSYVVAVVASYTVLVLARQLAISDGVVARLWLGAGSVASGIGIWSMHFVGMLAFSMDMSFTYDVPLTLLSLLVGIGASALTLHLSSRNTAPVARLLSGGLILGIGIAGMHYTGMEAMRMPAKIVYDPKLVALSVLIAVSAATTALWLAFKLKHSNSAHLQRLRLAAAAVMGLAISGMHYVGMFAASYETVPGVAVNLWGEINQTLMAVTVGIATMGILAVMHLTIFFDVRLSTQRDLGEKLSRMVEERTAELKRHAECLEQSNERLEFEAKERKRVEDTALYLSEVLDESSNEIYVFDIDTLTFIQVNKGAVRNTGFSRHELLAMSPMDLFADLSQEQFNGLLRPLRSEEMEEIRIHSTSRRKEGSTYPTEVHIQRIRVARGHVFCASVTDISDRARLEAQLIQAQKMESIGQLAAGVAHELNTPAQFVGDNIRFLKDGFDDLLSLSKTLLELRDVAGQGTVARPLHDSVDAHLEEADFDYLCEEIPNAIDQALEGISRVSHIVRAMKDYSHPGNKTLEAIDLNSVIKNTLTISSSEWKYAADIETELDDGVPYVICARQQIAQAILNLIVNAAHAIGEADTHGTDKGLIRVTTKAVDEAVEIRIADSGCGIPEEIRERVFDPFFTTKEVGRGTGQGLAMAYKTVVDEHGGTLSFESETGRGTTFIIRLPLEPTELKESVEAA